ncbi:uncharacterized protein ssp5 [Drosophila pseudoobscura]|uniref:Uncharacterized protein ssp5 n=1 Tax=Drosophila pseudoobscura pseudoobscura TaxID=46245 RepID=A0A6I8URC3_DROPS|nr:uncharacterized protein LOC4802593 [Drosophila pseudoobscura]
MPIATWYTVLSDFQLEALYDLAYAIKDDADVGTTERTRICLARLGITPMLKRRQLQSLVYLSRSSDLAFLYFLLEGHYKSCRTPLTSTEQILMSCIMFLDLEMTFRELDRILPPGYEPRVKEEQTPQVCLRVGAPKERQNSKSKSSYFQKLSRPGPARNMDRFSCKHSSHVVSFPFWPPGQKATYKVNDADRWFATYQFQPVKRVLLKAVSDIMDKYWKKLSLGEVIDRDASLCKNHVEALRQEQLVKDEIAVKIRDRCLDLVDLEVREDVRLKKRVISLLDKDIEDCTLRWKKLKGLQYTHVDLVRQEGIFSGRRTVSTPACPAKMKYMCQEDDIRRLETLNTASVQVITEKNRVRSMAGARVSDPEEEPCLPLAPEGTELELPKCSPPPPVGKSPRKGTTRFTIMENELEDLACSPCRFFEAAKLHKPFLFHYQEISPDAPESEKVIGRQVLRSLRATPEDMSGSGESMKGSFNYRAQVVETIVQCAKSMWLGSLEAYQRQWEKENTPLGPNCTPDKTNPLYWIDEIKYFDPNNSKLMERLRRDAFRVLRRDPRLVFAAFPDSYKAVVVQEWVKRRYGKVYHHTEVEVNAKKAELAFFDVISQQKNAPSVQKKELMGDFKYSQSVELVATANRLRNEYYHFLNEKLLQETRTCWKAMSPQFLKSPTVKSCFFAYLPARHAEMLRR